MKSRLATHLKSIAAYLVMIGTLQPLTGGPVCAADPANYLSELVAELGKTWPHNRQIRIVCHGHSVPAGYFTGGVVRPFDSYPHLLRVALKRRYPTAVVEVIGTAIGGEHAESGTKRFEAEVLALRPDVVTIDYALNDRAIGLDRARVAWEQMIQQAITADVKVILLTPTADTTASLEDPADPLVQHAAQIRQLAEEHDVALADSFTEFGAFVQRSGDLATVMSQANHPNRRGHEMVIPGLLRWFDGAASE